ncbi:MAG: SHOCT domain-containing protein [Desulfomonilaceae bacterium]
MVHYQEEYEQRSRNPRTALLLALLLGPIGMFYATVTWAAIMLFMNIVFGALTYGIAIIILWPVGARIAYKTVHARNQKLLRQKSVHMGRFPLLAGKHPQGLMERDSALCGANDQTKTLSPDDRQEHKTYRQRNALIRLGVGLIRTAGEKCFSKGLTKSWPKTEFTKMLSSFSARKPLPLCGTTLKPNEETFGAFELRLMSLKNLRDKGLIDELEFNNKKKAILDEL